ncbi:hypothetical protein CXB51_013174 [Gossypium anomalum]|uniref:Uncharacterized protein n=6 Tax=Gossypium TaxID=3633 RepID=A0ABR0PSU0_GOSAR|nr:hypothetical protein ES319_A05G039200v1 [Gossypium barbadense]KAG4197667.1 hypothetical protein ERO13_A05G038100v2 [Gossypium hirsutum]KAG8495475.1 hypothetical protein CXB51_013174 [Gossypium anomalum]KAK5830034.1 hypothetical protein PVK06_013828 [Gossypium arboreum]TYH15412.1 hypothetical protein ES288_A05G040100v1 [Gossypium darwinii]TYI25314.1 hypothetical protein ES332_A05G041600v1 [Gossypium tomentosum]TYJ32518.1 hypothetical protein E1A91_A05G040600v1 [Gossypium mustelinum]
MGSVGLRSSRSVSVVLARLLLLNICIGVVGIGAVAMTQNALASERQDSCPDKVSGSVTCFLNCDIFSCLAGCFTNPSMGCGLMCFARNVGCTTTCSIIEFPDP